MNQAAAADDMRQDQDRRIAAAIEAEWSRLSRYIRNQVADPQDAEDLLQDVFSELVEAYRLMKPIERAGAWLFRVARNRVVDLFRKNRKRPQSLSEPIAEEAGGHELLLEDLLPSPDAGPEAAFVRSRLIEALEEALDELPAEQREVFLAHEAEGMSFQELTAATGVNINTLLSRKRYAVRHLRERLQAIYDEFRER